MFYLLNTPILTNYGAFSFKKLPIQEAKEIIKKNKFISAIGHEATATALGKILSYPIPYNRIAVEMKKGDKAIVFRLVERLPEGVLLSEDEIFKLNYELGLLTMESD
jgi:hypothetical protein